MATIVHPAPTDTPEVRRYNRIKRWLGISDAVIGFAVLVILLVTGLDRRAARLGLHAARASIIFSPCFCMC